MNYGTVGTKTISTLAVKLKAGGFFKKNIMNNNKGVKASIKNNGSKKPLLMSKNIAEWVKSTTTFIKTMPLFTCISHTTTHY